MKQRPQVEGEKRKDPRCMEGERAATDWQGKEDRKGGPHFRSKLTDSPNPRPGPEGKDLEEREVSGEEGTAAVGIL